MNAELWQKVSSHFDHACRLASDNRSAYLGQLRAKDAEVAQEVARMLAGLEGASSMAMPTAYWEMVAVPTPFAPLAMLVQDDWPAQVGPFKILGPLKKGGMGMVLRAEDTAFDRTLAVKLPLSRYQGQAEINKRFVAEARITGRLQHPNIPPVHQRGELPDGRPYFAMKLIHGKTLDKILHPEGNDAPLNLTQLLAIFEKVAQAVAYAHGHDILHRDLKPLNIMVDKYGEVQVMDWGLGKELKGEAEVEEPAPQDSTFFRAAAAATDSRTEFGSVFGSPRYMPPEQAQGLIHLVDKRADVFALGAILCEILTGRPPYQGASTTAIVAKARAGDMQEAFQALEACAADRELIDLAKHCLAKDRKDRPADAGLVAKAVADFQHQFHDRLERAKIDRGKAEVKALEEGRRRRLALGLAAAVVLLVVGVSGAGVWYVQDRATRAAQVNQRQTLSEQEINETLTLARNLRKALQTALTPPGGVFKLLNNPADWQRQLEAARAALRRAQDLGAGAALPIPDALTKEISTLTSQVDQDEEDRKLALRLDQIRMDRFTLEAQGGLTFARAAKDYSKAFQEASLEPVANQEKQFVERVRSSPIREQLLAGLYDWSIVARHEGLAELTDLLLVLATQADPDPWGPEFKDPTVWFDLRALGKVADQLLADPKLMARWSPQKIHFLSYQLYALEGTAKAETLVRKALLHHPGDFWLNFSLAELWTRKKPAEAIGRLQAALAVRPTSISTLTNLGNLLDDLKDYDGAIAAFHKALEINDQIPSIWNNLGVAYKGKKNLTQAIEAYQKALALDKHYATAWNNLGLALKDQGDWRGGLEALRESLKLNEKNANTWNNLGILLTDQDLDEAISAFENAVKYQPNAKHWKNLGQAHHFQKNWSKAAFAYKKGLLLDPKDALGHAKLGSAFYLQKKYAEAIKSFEDALKIDPLQVEGRIDLGIVLMKQGQFAKAEQALKFASQLKTLTSAQSAILNRQWQKCQDLQALAKQLPTALAGAKTSAADLLALADLCQQYQQRYADAVTLYAAAFAAQPDLAEDLAAGHRANAALAAALAAAELQGGESTKTRSQALAWLRDDLQAWSKKIQAGPPAVLLAQDQLEQWQTSPDWAIVRDEKLRARWPALDQTAWRELWADVAKVQDQIRASYVETMLEGTLSAEKKHQVHLRKFNAGKRYVIDLTSKQFDTVLRLEDSAGKMLLENDDVTPDNRNSQIIFKPLVDGAYRLVARSFNAQGSGAYVLTIREFAGKRK